MNSYRDALGRRPGAADVPRQDGNLHRIVKDGWVIKANSETEASLRVSEVKPDAVFAGLPELIAALA